jgi:hydrogenase expression/formation protein HypC
MCLAIPAKVIEIMDAERRVAKVEVGGVRRNVSLDLMEAGEVAAGDYVLIHVGFAMTKIDEKAAEETLRLLDSVDGWDEGERF